MMKIKNQSRKNNNLIKSIFSFVFIGIILLGSVCSFLTCVRSCSVPIVAKADGSASMLSYLTNSYPMWGTSVAGGENLTYKNIWDTYIAPAQSGLTDEYMPVYSTIFNQSADNNAFSLFKFGVQQEDQTALGGSVLPADIAAIGYNPQYGVTVDVWVDIFPLLAIPSGSECTYAFLDEYGDSQYVVNGSSFVGYTPKSVSIDGNMFYYSNMWCFYGMPEANLQTPTSSKLFSLVNYYVSPDFSWDLYRLECTLMTISSWRVIIYRLVDRNLNESFFNFFTVTSNFKWLYIQNTFPCVAYSNNTDVPIWDDGYDNGYRDGKDVGYNEGFDKGRTVGDSEGYYRGKNDGIASANDYSFNGLVGAVVDAPISAFSSLLNFNILGINLFAFITGLLTLFLIIFVIRKLRGG